MYLEEQINLLLCEPERGEIRYRAVNWVVGRLKADLVKEIREACDITPGQWEAFLAGKEPIFSRVQQKLFSFWSFSRQEKQELRLLGKVDKAAVAGRMLDYLLKKERTAFQKRAGITATAWSRFLNCSSYTQDGVIDQIISGLELTKAEEELFRRLVFRDTFSVSQDLKDHVRELILGKKPSISGFLLDAQLSENAWEPFRTNPKNLPTSQATLLKIILGLCLPETGGTDLLRRVDSDFVMRRDLAVLICIRGGIFDIDTIYYILEFFAEGYGGERYFRNLYRDPETI